MHPKLFASLLEAMESWSSSVCETEEWDNDAPCWTSTADMSMAKAAAAVYDAIVSTSEDERENISA